MTRKEAIDLMGNRISGQDINFRDCIEKDDAIDVIQQIYDTFENKICKYCKHGVKVDEDNSYECVISRELFGYDNIILLGNFGCNRFNLEGE